MDIEAIAAGDEFASRRRLGAILADARTSRGVELTDIARETRIPIRHLAAIEADAHDSLPALPYAIGFVKSFARAVGIDGDAAGAQFRAETSKTAHVPAPAPMAPLDERRLPPRGLVTVSVVAVLAVIGAVVAWSAGAFDTIDHASPASVAVASAAPAASPTVALPSVAAVPAAASPASGVAVTVASAPGITPVLSLGAPIAAGAGTVIITAGEDAWFRVSGWNAAANKVVAVKSGVLAKGERYVVPALPGLKLWTGRAGALQLSLDGHALPSLGGPVETVKNISLDPVALRARMNGPVVGAAAR